MNYKHKHFSIVDFLKGYSIFTIVLMHLIMGNVTGVLSKAVAFGGAGVHVFILCSGFGLYLSHLRRPVDYVDFLKRRFSRVWKPYAFAVLLWGFWLFLIENVFPLKEVMGHLLLYKMFSTELDTSLCYPYWFISTISQFYIVWPIIIKMFKMRAWGIRVGWGMMMLVSLIWSSLVGLFGMEEERPWGSFFLQYLWEFGVGMWIAEMVFNGTQRGLALIDIRTYRWHWLGLGACGGMFLSALMAWNGGILKLYNDIPSLIGYLSLALLLYKIGIGTLNVFFEWAGSFSYELYLLHTLVFVIGAYILPSQIPIAVRLLLCGVTAYIVAYGYKKMIDRMI